MAIGDRQIFATPAPEDLVVKKEPVAGRTCPECGSDDISRYPVGHFKGPRMVVKCQNCFHPLAVERPREEDNWPPFRAVAYSWDPSPSERASAARR
jgi:ssDNA-binding Zn-finger/Zn-ribbon topoisomerase 1